MKPFPPAARRTAALAAFACVASLLAGCAFWRPTTVPMRSLLLRAECAAPAETLIAFLPGSYSAPEDYLREGFVARLRERHVAADVRLVDAHLGYYSERSIVDRLQADVVAPARAAGYRRVWLVGISIGGYGALAHSVVAAASGARRGAADDAGVDGIVLIAPYLGERRVVAAIESSGGLARWPAPADALPPDQGDQTVWRWLQGYARGAARPDLYLGYGRDDRFELGDRLLAAALPAGHVASVPGGHDWPAWNAAWDRLLPALPLPVDASCRPG